jgi:hypothetical protein
MWTKAIVFGAAAIYVILFVLFNHGTRVSLDFVFHKYEAAPLLLVLLLTAIFSVVGWWSFRTVFKTLRQLREVKDRSRLEKLEKEHAEMKAKAAMLQTRPPAES